MFILISSISLLLGSCLNRATATLEQSTDLSGIKSLHVIKFAPDSHGVNLLITDKLRTMGFLATTGDNTLSDVDAVVTYEDKWRWDFSMYMLELTITIRDPETQFPLASGNSYHTSISRKSPEEMVGEVIGNIFKKGI